MQEKKALLPGGKKKKAHAFAFFPPERGGNVQSEGKEGGRNALGIYIRAKKIAAPLWGKKKKEFHPSSEKRKKEQRCYIANAR